MKKTIDSQYKVSLSLMKACEYMYRKGVMDAATTFDEATINNFLSTHDPRSDFALMFDFEGRVLRVEHYAAMMMNICHIIKAKRAAILFTYGASKRPLIHGACSLSYVFYRNGLRDGIGCSMEEARLLVDSLKTDKCFTRIKLGVIDRGHMLSEMLTECMELNSGDFRPGYKIWKFINDGIIIKSLTGTFINDGED